MATIAAAAIVAGGAAYAANASSKSAADQNALVEEQIEEARRIRKQNTALADEGQRTIYNLLDEMPGLSDFMTEGAELATQTRDDRLEFLLGDTISNIRLAQQQQSALAAGDFSGAGQAMRDIMQSSLFDTASLTRDSAAGAFANISTANRMNLMNSGLQNAMGIGSWLGQLSGVDQFNPYRQAQDLFSIEQGITNSRIQAVNNRIASITETNNNWFNQFSDLSQAQMAIEANKTAANIAAVNQATGAFAQAIGTIPERQATNASRDFYTQLSQWTLRSGMNPNTPNPNG